MSIYEKEGEQPMPRRRLFVVLLLLLLLLLPFGLTATWPSMAPGVFANASDDGQEGYSLIIMNHTRIESARTARDYVVSLGGRIELLGSTHVMTGWLPPGLSARLIGNYGIEMVVESSLDPEGIPYQDQQTRALVSFFNDDKSGRVKNKMAFVPEISGDPLIHDVFQRPALDYGNYLKNVQRAEAVPSPGNSDSMTGTVAVYFFFIESDGSIDPDTYTWSETDQQATIKKALAALSWWSNQASRNGVSLTFAPFYHLSNSPVCRQGYEPILHSIADDHLWIDRIMENAGFSSGNTFDRVVAFNTWLRQSAAADWAFSVFIAYNPSPAATRFAGGQYFTYSFYGGPYVQTLFIPDGWGQENFDRVLAHETGHIFWGCDEYYQAGYGGCMTCGPCVEGPRPGANNENCEYCNPNAIPCMMRDCSFALCPFTRQQIGWLAGGRLSVEPAEKMTSSGVNGGPYKPESMSYTMQNTGDMAMAWTASKGQPWTSLSVTEGSLSPGSSTNIVVSIGPEASQLPPGAFTDTIIFNNIDNGEGNTTRTVVLTVKEGTTGNTGASSSGGGGGGGCFIASVAFGNADTKEVCILRRFRDDFLTSNWLGRMFVEIYYRYSPALAAQIKKSPLLCSVTRVALEPIVFIIGWGQKTLGKKSRQVYINGCERPGTIQRGGRMAVTPLH
jgi:hypothetical protein